MMRLTVLLVSLAILLLGSPHASAKTIRMPMCPSTLSEGPLGDLDEVSREAGGSNGGSWFRDSKGTEWFLKTDRRYSDLQSSAEVISAKIYRHLGYPTPETVKVFDEGIPYSASKNTGTAAGITDLSGMNTPLIRRMRFVAAYLKDWDRLGNYSNNLKFSDNQVVFIDFGGTLGSRAQGLHKPGTVFSEAIGAFEATTDINEIYGSFRFEAAQDHPWLQVSRRDALDAIEIFKTLGEKEISEIVKSARYKHSTDEEYMIHALIQRRNGIIAHLLDIFPR